MNNIQIGNIQDATRKIESLTLMCQASAEHGDLCDEIFADVFEIIRDLNTGIKNALASGKGAAA